MGRLGIKFISESFLFIILEYKVWVSSSRKIKFVSRRNKLTSFKNGIVVSAISKKRSDEEDSGSSRM